MSFIDLGFLNYIWHHQIYGLLEEYSARAILFKIIILKY